MSIAMLFIALIGGVLIAESAIYLWHRLVCHTGLLRWLLTDVLRRRHFDHHTHKYPATRTRSEIYFSSCDIAFRPLGMILAGLTITTIALGWISFRIGTAGLIGILFHGILATRLHYLYHVSDEQTRHWFILRGRRFRATLQWLRQFHDIHHLVNGNYASMIPLLDWIGGTYIPPSKSSDLVAEDLFPVFNPKLSSSCGERLFRRGSGARS